MNTSHGLCTLKSVTELVFHHAHNAMGVLSGVSRITDDVLAAQLADVVLFHVEVLLSGQAGANTTAQISKDFILMVDVVTCQTTTGVGQDLIRYELAGGELHRAVSGLLTGSKHQLSGLDDITQLGADVRFTSNVVHISYQSSLGCDNLSHSSLAAGIRVTMVMSEHQGKVAAILGDTVAVETVQEHAILRDKHIIKDSQRFNVADVSPWRINVLTLVMLTGQSHQLDAGPVCRQSEGQSIGSIILAHKLGGINNDLINIGSAGVADLCTANDDTLAGLAVDADAIHVHLNDMDELIRVGLHVSALVLRIARTLHIGLSTVAHQIVLLTVLNVLCQTIEVVCTAGLITVIGNREDSVQSIGTHAALHATTDTMTDQTSHQLLLQQIIHGVMNMRRAIDVVTGDVAFCNTNILITRIICCFIAFAHNIGAANNPVG